MEPYGGRLFRTLEYRSRLRSMAPSGPMHAAYFSEHPGELAPRVNGLMSLEKEIAAADLENCDREALLSELKSYRKDLSRLNSNASDDLFGPLKPTGRDVIVAAASAVVAAYAAWNGRPWFERKVDEFFRKQAEYVAEEMGHA